MDLAFGRARSDGSPTHKARDVLRRNHVAEEIRRGYKLREKLLRPALVRVVSNPKQTNE